MIRPAKPSDARAIAAIYAPIIERTVISFEEVAPSAEDMVKRISDLQPDYPYLVAEQNGTVVGYAYGSPHRSRSAYRYSADVTVYVAEDARRTGTGRMLYHYLLLALKERGMHRAYAGIALPNPASVALHEACGFQHVGIYHEVGFKCGKWHDVGWWECDLAAYP
ncbi:MAG: N-acetyltransferase [Sulfitobacter sp.]|nr:N-acetyltransferase [Sulfitobacter sp.]